MPSFDHAKQYIIDGANLTTESIYEIAFSSVGDVFLKIDEQSLHSMQQSRDFVYKIIQKGEPVYSINTGFGALSNVHIPNKDLDTLQYNLIRSHCTGVGEPFSKGITRAIMVLRANCLALGHSGVNPEIVQLLLDFINYGITPVVPSKGSVGASGDLAPLSHIAICLIGEGEVEFDGQMMNSSVAINNINRKPAKLGPKDGLALINGTAVMASLGSLALYEARRLVKVCDIAASLTIEGLMGSIKAFHPKISGLKPHPGQISVAQNMNTLLQESQIMASHFHCGKVQDPYSLRCIPQVHGACRQTLEHTQSVFDIEINSVTDNPLIFVETQEVLSGGNFHGEAVALAMDYLAMGLAELCNISERRIEKMMNPTFSDLPAFLVKDSGLNSGLMIAHVTAAALASENKYLCHPASIDSIPTSTDKEDHVSMGVTSGRKLLEVVRNLKHTLAIELLCNTQAIDFRRPLKSTPALEAAHDLIRKHVPPIEKDRYFHSDIKNIERLISSHELLATVENISGELL